MTVDDSGSFLQAGRAFLERGVLAVDGPGWTSEDALAPTRAC